MGTAIGVAVAAPRPVAGAAATHPCGCADTAAGVVAADDLAAADERFSWIDTAVTAAVSTRAMTRRTWSDRIDRFATAPVVGPLLFLAVMWVVFQATTTLAVPLQDALDTLVSGPLTTAGGWLVDTVGLGQTPVRGLVVDGVLAGSDALTFVPLMALIFVAIALLEDSGYLARAAFVADRAMRAVGLDGRAVIPLVVGFGCNLPALSATRILPHSRQRLLTGLLVPLTSCTARLTVYLMLASCSSRRTPDRRPRHVRRVRAARRRVRRPPAQHVLPGPGA